MQHLVNVARGGETSATILADGQLSEAVSAIADPGTDVHVVTLDIGGDDLLPLLKDPACASDPTGLPCLVLVQGALASFAQNLPAILGQLSVALASDPGAESVLVLTYYNPFSGTASPFEAPVDLALLGQDLSVDCAAAVSSPQNAGLNDLIVCTSVQFGMTPVDIYPLFEDRGTQLTHIQEGDIHPNQRGYRAIADQLAAAVASP